MDVSTVTRDAAIGAAAAVVVPAAIYAGPRLFKRLKAKREAQAAKEAARDALEAKRDETLADVARLLREIGGDVRCLYSIQAPQLEALEITLMSLHGAKLNGNVGEALDKVRAAKKTISDRLMDKVGDCGAAK